MMAVKKDLLDKIVVEHKTDLVNYLYFIFLEIRDLDQQSKQPRKKTQVLNTYDNRVGQGCIWTGNIRQVRRALDNIKQKSIIKKKFLMAIDINAYSLVWNSHCYRKQNVIIFKEIIEQFGLFINNKPGRAIRFSSRDVSIIDLALLLSQVGPLTLQKISEKYLSLSDHELIVLRWENVEYNSVSLKDGQITGWNIQNLINDNKGLQAAKLDWTEHTGNRPILDVSCNQQELDKEVEWVEALLTQILNTHCKKMRVTPFSKRWWNKEVADA